MDKIQKKFSEKNEFYLKDALSLAYLGDVVFSLMVREYLVKNFNLKLNELNKKANNVVCARTQSELMKELYSSLTEDETDIVKRARNSHTSNKAKNSTLEQYNLATQFEALVGYWYLLKENTKLENMFQQYVKEMLWLLKELTLLENY